jgi:hypothetical protein
MDVQLYQHLKSLYLWFSGLIVFSIAFGITVGQLGEKARVMCTFFMELNEIIMRIVGIVMWYVQNSRPIYILSFDRHTASHTQTWREWFYNRSILIGFGR